jgi:hypothetical protein
VTIPTHQKWRAGQLLRWVLTRDEMAVAAMAESYGNRYVEQGEIIPVRPETWDDVVRAFLMGDEPPTERSRSDLKTAIDKAELELFPAWQKIYKALRSGALDSWARPNRLGDLIRIDPIEYERFRFRSLDGHDFVIPVDICDEPLCPHPIAEYLTGAIPATTTPTVWPDPLFSAQQAMSLWPPHEPSAATSEPGLRPAHPMTGEVINASASLVDRLAEWIFTQHRPKPLSFEALLNCVEQHNQFGQFKKDEFRKAHRLVYATEKHAPPVTGWPLREPYKSRWESNKSLFSLVTLNS